jgi:hypothetical protein
MLLVSSISIGYGNSTTSEKPKKASPSETLGAFIIISGDRSDHALQDLITGGSDQVYNIVTNDLGFPASRVDYLGPIVNSSHPHVQALSSWSNIQNAIETWAVGKVDATHGLGLYLFDHGGTDVMAIPGGGLSDYNLNSFLNALQASTNCSRHIIIYEACESGSFINVLSQTNRVIVTSTDAGHSAYGSSDWAIFSESFWGSIAAGNSIGQAFIAGTSNVYNLGYSTVQYPLLDDNGDGVGNAPYIITFPQISFPIPINIPPQYFLPNGGDGMDAVSTPIKGFNPFNIIYYPIISAVSKHTYLPNSTIYIPIWAKIQNISTVAHIWARVMPPYWTPPSPPNPDTQGSQIIQDLTTPMIELSDQLGDGNYSGYYDARGQVPGDFYINIIPEGEAGLGPIVTSTVTLNQNGTAPLERTHPVINILSPLNQTFVSGIVNITAYGDDVQGLKSVQLYLDGVSVENQTMPEFYPYPDAIFSCNTTLYGNGVHNITAIATNNAGLTSSITNQVYFYNISNSGSSNSILGYFPIIVIGVSILSLIYILQLNLKKKARHN